ncbi:adhesion G-protein coupled receptor G6-like, partial [Chaetodon trifascialis]|uniref:adhesion G-protein coupled receptor G6-like n=1 Tax=Chaetodon trifascialis TaxID=109706 RepID=UPI003995766A
MPTEARIDYDCADRYYNALINRTDGGGSGEGAEKEPPTPADMTLPPVFYSSARLKWWLFCWLVLSLVSHEITCKIPGQNQSSDQGKDPDEDEDQHQGSDQGKDPDSDEDQHQGSDQGKDPDEDEDQHQGSDQGKDPESDEDQCQGSGQGKHFCKMFNGNKPGVSDARSCMEDVNNMLTNGNSLDTIKAIESLEQILEETEVTETTSLFANRLVALLHRPKGRFAGLEIYASENEATPEKAVTNSKVSVRLPKELDLGPDNTVVFCMLTWPESNGTAWGASGVLYESRLVGLSVRGKTVSGLQERVNITMNLTMYRNETQEPRCVFFNFSTQAYSNDGCETLWEPGQSYVTCSCDHLTYFGVLMVSASLSPTDLKILTYITLIGCSLSLFSLVLTVLLFITKRKVRADVSMKVHINLAMALILLNLHFLPSHTVAALSSTGLCLYVALSLHYFLLATFSWMALEGFHLYLLLVKVFNIYVRRY